jgi:hypothetical protein
MGTAIELYAGSVSLSYSKNVIGEDSGVLFQQGDIACRRQDQISYVYYEEHSGKRKDLSTAEEEFARKLLRIVPRLEILGYTLQAARDEYEGLVAEAIEMADLNDADGDRTRHLAFDEFFSFASRHPLESLQGEHTPMIF